MSKLREAALRTSGQFKGPGWNFLVRLGEESCEG